MRLNEGRSARTAFQLPDEVSVESYVEGATSRITVNGFERSAKARKACIEHYGTRCFVCELKVSERYGLQASGLIHVHHLTPLATVADSAEVDPIRDLRPVCPTCHAVIHLVDPPYTPEQIREMIGSARAAQ